MSARKPLDNRFWPFATKPPAERAGWLASPCVADPLQRADVLDTWRAPKAPAKGTPGSRP